MPARGAYARIVARWLRDHAGVLTTADAHRLGIPPDALRREVEAGRLAPAFRGVYVDGSVPLSPELLHRAAVAAGGRDAVASHRSSGWLWDLLPGPPARPAIMVDWRRKALVSGVIVHRSDLRGERAVRRGVPVTSARRCLLDLATLPDVSAAELARAVDQALVARITTVPKLVELMEPAPGRRLRGAPRLRAVLDDRGHLGAPDASALERRTRRLLTDLCRAHRLPEPVAEHPVCGGRYRLDFAWPHLRLAVEVDGYAWHSSPEAMARDRARRNVLANEGWTVLTFTWRQVVDHPEDVCAQILTAYRKAAAGKS